MQFLEVEKWRAVQPIYLMDGKWGALDSFGCSASCRPSVRDRCRWSISRREAWNERGCRGLCSCSGFPVSVAVAAPELLSEPVAVAVPVCKTEGTKVAVLVPKGEVSAARLRDIV
jgi:hypothetical protein